MVVGSLLGLLLVAWSQDVRDRAPVDPDARLPEDVRASLAAIDPSVDGWGSEVLAGRVTAALHELEAALESGHTDGLERFASPRPDLASVALAPRRADGALHVALDDPAAQAVSLADLGQLVEHLRAQVRAAGAHEVHAHFKLIGVDSPPDRPDAFEVDLRLELASRGPDGARQWTGTLRAQGALEAETGTPRVSVLAVDSASLAHAPAGPLFTDVTAAALAGDVLERQLAPGLDHWRDRVDTNLGVGTLGHHGLALGDVDGDGLEDLYLCQPGGLPNRLYLRRADGTTEEVAARAGVDVVDSSQSALIVDLDGDGARDLVLAGSEEVALFAGDGRGRFHGVARIPAPGATSLAAADVDLDGDLDLHVCGYVSPYDGTGAPEPYHDAENGQRDLLLVNQGRWSFVDGTRAAGLGDKTRFSFAAAFEDLDDDGDPDLYVANDFGRNQLFLNAGDGTFRDVAAARGVEDLSAGMGVSFADVDGDGRLDLHVANMFSSAGNRIAYQRRFQASADASARAGFQRHARGDSLFLNRGEQGFVDVSVETGITMGRWAWGALFLDFENDGLPDLYVPNGFVTGARSTDL